MRNATLTARRGKAHVGLSLPDFAVSAAAQARSKIRAAAACGWTCVRAVLRWLFVRTESLDRMLKTEYAKSASASGVQAATTARTGEGE
ncbi:hypothetical protein QPK87_28765 [Kamptonema cortianum]|nr:hypothetical protein [Kamptonema cortianum]